MIATTLNRIREHNPCSSGWVELLAHLGKTKPDDEPLPFATILESNGLVDALWCCRVEPHYSREWRLFAVRCARSVQHLMSDPRSIAALDVAERHANGQATNEELSAARDAARDAAWAVGVAARVAVGDVAWDAAGDAARAAVGDVAWDAAWAAAWAAGDAAGDAAGVAARHAAGATAWAAFSVNFLETVS